MIKRHRGVEIHPPKEEGIHDLQMNVERGRGLVTRNFKLLKLADNILKKKKKTGKRVILMVHTFCSGRDWKVEA